jgi:hypothetical protein
VLGHVASLTSSRDAPAQAINDGTELAHGLPIIGKREVLQGMRHTLSRLPWPASAHLPAAHLVVTTLTRCHCRQKL